MVNNINNINTTANIIINYEDTKTSKSVRAKTSKGEYFKSIWLIK